MKTKSTHFPINGAKASYREGRRSVIYRYKEKEIVVPKEEIEKARNTGLYLYWDTDEPVLSDLAIKEYLRSFLKVS